MLAPITKPFIGSPETALPQASALATVSLDDKYTSTSGQIYLSGVQALVRLPLIQRQREQITTLQADVAKLREALQKLNVAVNPKKQTPLNHQQKI